MTEQQQKERKAFEKEFGARGYELFYDTTANGTICYFNGRTQDAWEGFQAAWNTRATPAQPTEVVNLTTSGSAALLERLRQDGWMVAVHNDYRLNGEVFTFWLFTKGNLCVKGEGRTDKDALVEVYHALPLSDEGGLAEEMAAALKEARNDYQALSYLVSSHEAEKRLNPRIKAIDSLLAKAAQAKTGAA